MADVGALAGASQTYARLRPIIDEQLIATSVALNDLIDVTTPGAARSSGRFDVHVPQGFTTHVIAARAGIIDARAAIDEILGDVPMGLRAARSALLDARGTLSGLDGHVVRAFQHGRVSGGDGSTMILQVLEHVSKRMTAPRFGGVRYVFDPSVARQTVDAAVVSSQRNVMRAGVILDEVASADAAAAVGGVAPRDHARRIDEAALRAADAITDVLRATMPGKRAHFDVEAIVDTTAMRDAAAPAQAALASLGHRIAELVELAPSDALSDAARRLQELDKAVVGRMASAADDAIEPSLNSVDELPAVIDPVHGSKIVVDTGPMMRYDPHVAAASIADLLERVRHEARAAAESIST